MNFLLIPKQGKSRFHTGDPFEYIRKKGMIAVRDYFNYYDGDETFTKDAISLNYAFTDDEGNEYYFIMFNKEGYDAALDMTKSPYTNEVATNLYNAYNSKYIGNYITILSDVILVKTNHGRSIEGMSALDKRKIKGMMKDAEWVGQYLGRNE